MAFWNFAPEELSKILAFLNEDNNEVLGTDIASRFMNMSAAFFSKALKAYGNERARASRAEKTIERLKVRLNGRIADGQFVELDFDSVDLAKCILYIMKSKDLFCSRNRIQYLLYEAYSRWLADHSERLVSEHPVVQEWGPHFWTVSHRLGKLTGPVGIDDFRKIAEKNPGVVKFLENVVVKYSTWSDENMKKLYTQSVPYKNVKPMSSGEKWGKEIKDADIFAWKK